MDYEYDIRITGGKVIDFETMQVSEKDICIRDGVFCSCDGGQAQFEVDASGKYVLPGLIDEHVHLNVSNSNIGANADLLCIPMGVTTAVDAGTCGWTNFEGFYRYNMVRYVPDVLGYLHVSPYGVHSGCIHEENHDPADFNEKEILKTAKKYKEAIAGLKVRMCRATLGSYGIEPLKRTVEIADHMEAVTKKRAVVDVHYDNLPEGIRVEDILDVLRPGDIVSHIMQTHGDTIFSEEGTVKEAVLQARRRGIIMDDCHGRVHWSFENLKKAFADGFYPDIISSDVVRISSYIRPGSSLLHAMMTNRAAGMDDRNIFRAVTYAPAKALGILDRAGTLEEGRPADVCIMDVQNYDALLNDWWGGSCRAEKAYVPLMTIKDGVIVYRQTFF